MSVDTGIEPVGDVRICLKKRVPNSEPWSLLTIARLTATPSAISRGSWGPVAEHHDLSIDATPAIVDGARDELHRMALNLMENALRHTPPGSRVHARTDTRGGEVLLVVEDDGPGVAPELRERAFERFVRGAGDRGSSSGLGLAIVRAVAESHGGRVTLEDARPGARFVVHMPLATAQAAVEPAAAIR